MNALIFLVLFPLCIAGLALVVPPVLNVRRIIGVTANIVLCVVPVYLLIKYLDAGAVFFRLESPWISPLMLVTASVNGKEIAAILQNAETIRLTRASGEAVSIVTLQPGDEVLVALEETGRHFGHKIQETILEK